MRFVEYVDYGDAATNFATGIASVELIAPNVVEVTLFRRVKLANGAYENRIVDRIIWDRDQWLQAGVVAHQARAIVESDPVFTETGLEVATSH